MTHSRFARPIMGPGVLYAAVLTLAIAVSAVGCGNSSPSGSLSAVASATAIAAASPSGSGQPGAKPTAWPGNAVIGIEAMGVADGQIAAGLADLNQGIATEDLALMRRAADGLAGTDVLLRNVDRIGGYEPMRSFADRYAAAITAISTSAKSLRAAIDARDATGITTSSQALIQALRTYSEVQPELAAWVQQAITQRRLLTQ